MPSHKIAHSTVLSIIVAVATLAELIPDDLVIRASTRARGNLARYPQCILNDLGRLFIRRAAASDCL
ncbi:uncharacterized protein N7459_009361 [Penicillium hispanicum]|uniref:uncharacterized protein n=1 Tax=Penicillium hispanicum TaxID=1080232 RepID=UPI00253FD1DF|nr:uncharacterized protein N7459_009361 [Penicillium hispanicum]KAJ5569931.1 hypothetical protein N7459_009361 [Penicillium hispanicum]